MGQAAAHAPASAPRKSCDCQFRIYEGLEKFPPRPNPPYPPIESATLTEAQRTHRAIGFDRGVIVHSAIYRSDHRLLLDALQSLDDRDRYRGIGIGRTRNGQSA
ncbi:MAG TPA: hypothetical protein VH851_14885 [Candidatus Binatia bacterium]